MSDLLLSKIGNIFEIDETKEYIVFDPVSKKYINLEKYVDKDTIIGFIEGKNSSVIEMTKIPRYDDLMHELDEAQSYFDVNSSLKKYNINFNIDVPIEEEENPEDEYETKENYIETLKSNKHLTEDFLYNKAKIIKSIREHILKSFEGFNELKQENKKNFISTGKWSLKLGWSFIQGHLSNNKYIFAPLFFCDLEIKIRENFLTLKKIKDYQVNEKLLLYILKENELDINQYQFSHLKTKGELLSFLESILKYKIKPQKQSPFFDNKDLYKLVKHVDSYFIGLFDSDPGKLRDDFIEIISNNDYLLNERMKKDFEHYYNEEFQKDALVQLNNPLNVYQKYALRSAINENTLIYGPPGTGKSEVITSMIANLIVQSKTVLVSSEKDAALDVIKKRLGKLSHFTFYLKDLENEKLFYDQIENLSEKMGSFYNDEYKNSNFNLQQYYSQNERIIDYNREVKKFRNIIKEQVDFSLEKDSRNNDYRDYLISINVVDEFIRNNKKGINEFWNDYKNDFVKLQTPTEFVAKVAEFNDFRTTYELSNEELSKFDQTRTNLTRFLVDKGGYVDYKIHSFDLLDRQVKEFTKFVKNQMLHKNEEFSSFLNENCDYLFENYHNWKAINEKLEQFPEEKNRLIKFLFKNKNKHEKFLIKYAYLETDKAKRNSLIKYFEKTKFLKTINKNKFKKLEILEPFLESLRIFQEMKLFKSNLYLDLMLKENSDIFHPLVLFFYQNPWLLKQSFIDFYNKKIVIFDSKVVDRYYQTHVNQIERELININVYNYEKLSKNQHIVERNVPSLIKQYLKDNYDSILNIEDAIYDIYVKFVKNRLAEAPKEVQYKVEQMFRIARMEKRPKINDFINSFIDCLHLIFPVWISKPDLLVHYTENKKGLFDVGIFDEASQMFLERAYPLIYRCKYIVVSGDDKQLKPERILFNKLKEDKEYKPRVDQINFDETESLLDRARVSYWNTYTLKNHYRSTSKDLIEFSNSTFYDNNLYFSSINHNNVNSFEVINISKSVENKFVNELEAKKVIEKLKKEVHNFPKTLVICFTDKQKEYISNQIEELGEFDLIERMRKNSLIIGDISSVQGSEADLVIISTVFTKHSETYPIICEPRGANYLNVAITRAKEKIIIVKSITKEDIKIDENSSYNDQVIFRGWIGYIDKKVKNEFKGLQILNDESSSSFKKDVFEKLSNNKKLNKYKIVQNLSIGSENIDIALYSKSVHDIDLILRLDEWKKHISMQDWFEDIDKEEYLISRGYKVLRIEETDWLKDSKEVIEQIERTLNI